MVNSPPLVQETGFNPWVRKIPWRRERQPTPVFLPGKSHGWRNLAGCNPCGCKESDMTEQLSHTHTLQNNDFIPRVFKYILVAYFIPNSLYPPPRHFEDTWLGIFVEYLWLGFDSCSLTTIQRLGLGEEHHEVMC